MIAFSFWCLVLLCCGFAAVWGGRDGRAVAAIYVLACLGTVAAWFFQAHWDRTHLATFAVDVVLLAALYRIALRSQRWFPLWFTAFHLVAVIVHLASMIAPAFAPRFYFWMQSLWSVPMLLSLVAGVVLDRCAGVIDGPRGRAAGRAQEG